MLYVLLLVTASVPMLSQYIPSFFIIILLKVAGESCVSGIANSSSVLV